MRERRKERYNTDWKRKGAKAAIRGKHVKGGTKTGEKRGRWEGKGRDRRPAVGVEWC